MEMLLALDDLILGMEVVQEKAAVMASLLDDNYFSIMDDSFKLHGFEAARTEHNILLDYIYQSVKLLQRVRELLSGERQEDAQNE